MADSQDTLITLEDARYKAEQQYIRDEQRKCDKALLRSLEDVHRTGDVGKIAKETLLINGFIEFSGPRPGFPYNHYKLTEKGYETLVITKARVVGDLYNKL